jgi:Rap1a immunity proteins
VTMNLSVQQVVVAAIMSLMLFPPSHASAETTLEIQSACRGVRDATIGADGRLEMAIDFSTGMCWGAFAAFQRLDVMKWPDGKRILGFCAPPESSRLQLVRIFMKYADDHPEEAHEGFEVVALQALMKAFPCNQ